MYECMYELKSNQITNILIYLFIRVYKFFIFPLKVKMSKLK